MSPKDYLKVLLQTSAAFALTMGTAYAQTAPNPDDSQADTVDDEVVVTGSRIRRDTFSSPVSMDVLNVEDAQIEGIADISGLLQTSTAASGSLQVTSAISTAFVTNGGVGAQNIGLRGLGANRTLDLINGRRAGPSGTRGSVSSFDLGSIPLVGVERVDILKDGASSVYGSDAIAGVINYITDKSEGGKIDLFTELPEESGGEVFRGSASYGKYFDNDKGRFRVTADYFKKEELAREDRSYLDCTQNYTFAEAGLNTRADVIDPRTGEPACQGTIWGHVWVYQSGGPADNIAQNPRNILFQFDRGGNLGNFIPSPPTSLDGTGIVTPPGWFQVEYFPDDILNDRDDPNSGNLPAWVGIDVSDNGPNAVTDLYPDMQRRNSVDPEIERITFMGDVEYEISDNVTAYAEGLFNRRSTYQNAIDQYWTYQYGANAVFAPGDPVIPNALYGEWGGTNTWFSPTPVVEWNDEQVDVDYMRFVGGLRGEFGDDGPFPNWAWDVYGQYSDSHGEYGEQFVRNDAIQDNWFATSSCVGSTSSGATATTNTGETVTVAGRPCVDVRWFDPGFLGGELTQAERDFLLDYDSGYTDYSQLTFEGFVTGDVIDVPAGKLSAALGYFFQEDEIYDRPSDTTLTGNEFSGSQAGITTGTQTTNALYGEINLPILRDQPLFENLNLSASGRFSEITSENRDGRSVSVDGFNYRATLDWRVSPLLRVRGSKGTSFRAPGLFEQFLADESSAIRQSAIDPCIGWQNALNGGDITQATATNCQALGIPADYNGAPIAAQILQGGGFGVLEPETSDNFTVGFVVTPDFADVSLAVDYFDITVEDEISTLSAGQIVAGCLGSENFGTEPLCELFDRAGDSTGQFRISEVRATFININEQTNKGIDFTLQYNKDTKWGDFDLNAQASHQLEDEILLLAEDATQFLNGGIGEPEWTGFANLTFSPKENLLFRWGVDYIGKQDGLRNRFDETEDFTGQLDANGGFTVNQDNTTVFLKTETEATFYHSLSAQYKMEGGWTFRAGVNNIFDEHPPALSNVDASIVRRQNSPIVSQYDLLGRRGFLNVTKTFQ